MRAEDLQQTLTDPARLGASEYDVRLGDLSARTASLESIFLDVAEGGDATTATTPTSPRRWPDDHPCPRDSHSPTSLLMRRNLLTVFYAVVVPLVPLGLLADISRADRSGRRHPRDPGPAHGAAVPRLLQPALDVRDVAATSWC